MTRFLDGPAAGLSLSLRRAPLYLRAACSRGHWDALDQLGDEPRPTERLTAYKRVGAVDRLHLKCQARNGSGWYESATYAVAHDQPDQETMRDSASWREWCVAETRARLAGGSN